MFDFRVWNPHWRKDDATTDHKLIVHHILNFVCPGIEEHDYKFLINFEPKENYSRHSAKISVTDYETKTKIFKGCAKFKTLNNNHYLRKIWIKNDDPPMTRKENERLSKKLKELRDAETLVPGGEPENRYHIKKGILYMNDECIDEFNLNNQLFC